MSDGTHWEGDSILPPPPTLPGGLAGADTEPPEPPTLPVMSMAPEALTDVLGRLTAAVELGGRASEGARDAALHVADALAAHVASERAWQESIERRIDAISRHSVTLPVVGVVLGAVALAAALGAIVLAAMGARMGVVPGAIVGSSLGLLGATIGACRVG
jgi:hypothetical protein